MHKLVKRENVIIIILIIGAILGTTGIPQRFGLTSDAIILGILAILAVDTLTERITYLERIESTLKDLDHKLKSEHDLDLIFKHRDESTSFPSLIEKGSEFWFAAKGIYGFLNRNGRAIQEAALNGRKFRFILHDPDNLHMIYAITSNSFTNTDSKNLRLMIKDSISQISRMADLTPPGAIELRLTQAPLYNGYTVIDANKATGIIYIEMFGYKISLGERLTLTIKNNQSPSVYSYHLKRYNDLWKDARPVLLSKINPPVEVSIGDSK